MAGLLLGASVTGVAGFLLGELLIHSPLWTLGVLAIVMAVIAAGIFGIKLEGSRWRVPGRWSRMGHIGDSGVFGLMVGTGVATALASPGFYVVLAWSLAATEYSAVWPVFLAFGIGRALPFLTIAARAYWHDRDVGEVLDPFTRITGRLGLPEALLLTALASMWLSGLGWQ
ncbi:MAG TPA: hypothetical protein DGT23_02520 [Micromonosporaceae bacterium]|nr:hypothetical protein [Micromonosporaceae bacterium]